MNNLEKYVKNTWTKVPQKFKNRFEKIQIIIKEVKEGEPFNKIEFDPDTSTFTIYTKPIESALQKEVDELVVIELSHHLGFTEEEAYELIGKNL